jgi:hypothetical protein
MSPQHASKLLDDVMYERVREHIDVCGLLNLRLELARMILANGQVGSRQEARALACAMVERALRRFAERATFDVDPAALDALECLDSAGCSSPDKRA